MNFKELHLIAPILKALETEGYTIPTPIQEQSIPDVLKGRDLLGCAQTGTGKTAAFAIPILQNLFLQKKQGGENNNIKALILTPTRELAIQIDESFASYGKHTGVRHMVVFGGVSQYHQTNELRGGIDILIATPGRLLDLVAQKFINLQHIKMFVLDEADRMLDMGFIHDVRSIVSHIPVERQTLLFSATLSSEIAGLASDMLRNPVPVDLQLATNSVAAAAE